MSYYCSRNSVYKIMFIFALQSSLAKSLISPVLLAALLDSIRSQRRNPVSPSRWTAIEKLIVPLSRTTAEKSCASENQ